MRYLFSQDSGTQIEFITERWFHFSGQKHGQGTRDPDVPLCPPAAQLPSPACANASVALCSGEQPLLQHLRNAMFHSNAVPPPCSSHCCSTCTMLFVPRSRCAAALSSHLPLFQELTSAYGHCCCALTSQLQQLQQYRTVSTPSRITPPPQPVLAATTTQHHQPSQSR